MLSQPLLPYLIYTVADGKLSSAALTTFDLDILDLAFPFIMPDLTIDYKDNLAPRNLAI